MKMGDVDKARDYYDNVDIADEIEKANLTAHAGNEPGSAMASYSVRMPAAVLEEARKIAKGRGITTGAWLREAIEAMISRNREDEESVPISVLLAAAEEYRHRKAS